MPKPSSLGHVGIHVFDLARMRDFYTRVLGLTVTDEDEERGMVFLSAQPDAEHHELVLVRGRTAPKGLVHLNQISFHVGSVEELQQYHELLKAEADVVVEQVVTHGIAYGIYFLDPEENRIEVYWATNEKWPQPYRKSLNLEQPVAGVIAEAHALLQDGLPSYQRVTAKGAG